MNPAALLLLLALGGLAALYSERLASGLSRWVSLAVCALGLLYLLLSTGATGSAPGAWLAYSKTPWLPRLGIAFELAVDGLSLLMLALTLLLGLVAVIASWDEIDFRQGFFQANLLWTLTGVCGVFMALDLVLFFLFWEVMLVPMYLLIAIWGHEDRSRAAMKFFIFTQASGLLLLVAIVTLGILHSAGDALSFSYLDLLDTPLGPRTAYLLMLGFFLAFSVKLPAFPFHTWLPDAHTQAPT
ncbi:MAG: proton-conducting transporter membrane subunit, partial [Parahaliea sp.]